jgi:hypothetical protein
MRVTTPQQPTVTLLIIESQKGILFAPGGSGVIGRVLLERKSVQIPDVLNDKKPVTDALLAVCMTWPKPGLP